MRLFRHLAMVMWCLSALTTLGQRNKSATSAKEQPDPLASFFENMKPRNIGPAGMSGRVTSIDVVLSNPDVIYAGTASGGLWKSENSGISWKAIFDDQPLQSIGAVAVQQSNPSVVWAGTGEGNPRNSHTSGAGIYKSLDGGRTWKLMGLKKTKTIHRIIIHRDNPDVVFAATLGSAWGPNNERGVFRTTDGGETWKKILFVNDETGCADLVVDPGNPNKLVAAMWEYGRKPWTFISGGKGSGLYISHDGGDTWQQRTDKHGLPKSELGRMGLAIPACNPNIVYALIESKKTALYKSTDGGVKWKKVADKNIGNRPFYYADIYADPQNENRLYNLYSIVSVSNDGGKTFTPLTRWSSIHPDHHAFWVHPDDPDFLIDGNDGGLNISHDRGKTWRFAENLPLAQFYHINYDMDVPYNVYGGMQDNGSWYGPSQVWSHSGIRNSHWQEISFGDGFDVVPDLNNPRYGYTMYQGGNLYRYDRETGHRQFVQPVHPEGVPLRFNWNAGIALDPHRQCGVYFGSQFLHHSTDCGSSWTIISPDLTTNDTAKQQQAKSGGLTIDATRAENNTTILCIAPSPVEKDVIWVGTDDGNLQLTRDGGKTWVNLINRLPEAPRGAWIPQIEPSQKNAGEAFVIINDYRRNNWQPYAYHTKDFGTSWTRIVRSSDVNSHCLSIVQDPVESKLLFLGTEQGLYFSLNSGGKWRKWEKNFPSAPVRDMKIHPREHDLIIGTFGRAAWILDDIVPLRALASQGLQLMDKPLHVFPAPVAIANEYKPVHGVRFGAHANFNGRNKRFGAMISVWVKELKKGKDEEKKENEEEEKMKEGSSGEKKGKGKFIIRVLNETGDTIRTFTAKPDTGFNRIYWPLNRNGVRRPSHNEQKERDFPPGGPRVLPGKYILHVSYDKYTDSTTVEVKPDPRLKLNQEDLMAREQMIERHQQLLETSTAAFNRLKETNKTVALVNKNLENAPDSVKKQIRKAGKTITDSVKVIMELFIRPKESQGYDHVTVRLNNYISRASSHVSSSYGKPGGTALIAMQQAESELQKVLDLINGFYDTKWKEYRKKVEESQLSLFKDYEPVEIKE